MSERSHQKAAADGSSPKQVGTPKPDANDEEQCPICWRTFEETRPSYSILCGHIFCRDCISARWSTPPAQWNGDCPTCRANQIHTGCSHLCSYRRKDSAPPLDPLRQLEPLCIDCEIRHRLLDTDSPSAFLRNDDIYSAEQDIYFAEQDSIRAEFAELLEQAEGEEGLAEEQEEELREKREELDRRMLGNAWNAVERLREKMMRERCCK